MSRTNNSTTPPPAATIASSAPLAPAPSTTAADGAEAPLPPVAPPLEAPPLTALPADPALASEIAASVAPIFSWKLACRRGSRAPASSLSPGLILILNDALTTWFIGTSSRAKPRPGGGRCVQPPGRHCHMSSSKSSSCSR